MPKVSVVIPTYNRKEKLRRLLNSLKKSTYRDFEIIVVDDASTDGTDEMIKNEFPEVIYIRHETETLVWKSRNDGIIASSGEIVFMVDDDNVVDPNAIEKIVKDFDKINDAGVIAPITCYYSKPDTIMYAGTIYTKYMRRTKYLYVNRKCEEINGKFLEVDGVANSFALRRDLALKAGLIPQKIPFNGEDGYLQYKIKKMGYKIIVDGSAKVYHDHEGSKGYNQMRYYYALRSKITFHMDLDEGLQKFTFLLSLPIYVGYYSYNAIKQRNWGGLKAVFEGTLDGLLKRYNLKYIKTK